MVARSWRSPAKSREQRLPSLPEPSKGKVRAGSSLQGLARLFWLGAPLKSEGRGPRGRMRRSCAFCLRLFSLGPGGSLKEHFESKALPSLLRSKQMDLATASEEQKKRALQRAKTLRLH